MSKLDDYLASLGFDPTTAYVVPENPTDAALECINAFVRERTCKNISNPPEGFLCSACRWGDFAEPSHLLTSAKYTGRDNGGPNYCPNCGRKVEQ